MAVTETDVEIKTPDGVADAVLTHPTTGTHPDVLVWTDIMGLRPAFRDMARRLAGEGYTVLTPNPFYRSGKVPPTGLGLNFQDPDARGKMMQLMGALVAPGAAERDAAAFVAWLDAQSQVKKSAKIGTSGYCMGGPMVLRTAAAVPNRVHAGASFHGGQLSERVQGGATDDVRITTRYDDADYARALMGVLHETVRAGNLAYDAGDLGALASARGEVLAMGEAAVARAGVHTNVRRSHRAQGRERRGGVATGSDQQHACRLPRIDA